MGVYQVLLIDDDPVITQITQRLLEKRGYMVRVAMDARKGLALALSYPPNLIVLDYMMPQKDGLALLADLRAMPELKNVPVIMMTGVSEPEVVAKAIQLGVTDFLAKPFYPPRLAERVAKYLPPPDLGLLAPGEAELDAAVAALSGQPESAPEPPAKPAAAEPPPPAQPEPPKSETGVGDGKVGVANAG